MTIKQQSTGDNDSLEDIAIAIMNLKTVDGKHISTRESWQITRQFMDSMMEKQNDRL